MTSRHTTTLVVFSLCVGAACIRLGVWQLDRLAHRRATSALAQARRALAPVPILGLGDSGANRRVVASGRYDFSHEFVLRGRARDGVPGVEVVTPLVLSGSDSAVLVLRGFVPSADAIGYAPGIHREPDPASVAGVAMPVPVDSLGAAPAAHKGAETWRRLDLSSIRHRLSYPVSALYIIADSPATVSPAPRRSAPPALDDGPHLNYAIQWFAFATIAFGGAVALWWNRRRESDSVP